MIVAISNKNVWLKVLGKKKKSIGDSEISSR